MRNDSRPPNSESPQSPQSPQSPHITVQRASAASLRFVLSTETAKHLLADLRRTWSLYPTVAEAVALIEAGQAKRARELLRIAMAAQSPKYCDLSCSELRSSPLLLLEAELCHGLGDDALAPVPEPAATTASSTASSTSTSPTTSKTTLISENGAVVEL